jgi:hypothetical protein
MAAACGEQVEDRKSLFAWRSGDRRQVGPNRIHLLAYSISLTHEGRGLLFITIRLRTEGAFVKRCHCEECNDEAISNGGAWEIATGCRPRNDMF